MTNQPKTLTIDGHTYESIQGHSIRAGDYFIAPGYPPVMTSLPTPPGETAPSGYYRRKEQYLVLNEYFYERIPVSLHGDLEEAVTSVKTSAKTFADQGTHRNTMQVLRYVSPCQWETVHIEPAHPDGEPETT